MGRWLIAKMRRVPLGIVEADDLPMAPNIEYKEIVYSPGDERAVTAMYAAYSRWMVKNMHKPAYMFVGKRLYEQYVATVSHKNYGLVIPNTFMDIPLVVVEGDMLAVVDTPKEMLAR